MERSVPGVQTAARLITHQVPLLGEQGVAHVDLDVIEIPVAALLAAETLLIGDVLHLRSKSEEKARGQGRRRGRDRTDGIQTEASPDQ